MYNIAICDDEPIFAENLQNDVNQILFAGKIEYTLTIFQNPQKLLEVMYENADAFHLLLLDIMMGNKNGIDIARELRRLKSHVGIIFITSASSFALDGYSVRPIQYLVKPVNPEQLKEAILYDYNQNFMEKRLLISDRFKTYSFDYHEICFIDVINHTLRIHKNEDTVECPGVLSSLEARLPVNFLRCHKSYIVNLDLVSDIRRYAFRLKNGSVVPISKMRYAEIQQAFVSYATR